MMNLYAVAALPADMLSISNEYPILTGAMLLVAGVLAGLFFGLLPLRRARREAAAYKTKLDAMLNAVADGIVITDADGKIIQANSAAEPLAALADDPASPLRETLQTGRPAARPAHAELPRPDGAKIQIADNAAPLRDESGAVTGAILILRDISAELHLRETLAVANQMLESAAELAKITYAQTALTGERRTDTISNCIINWKYNENGEQAPPEKWVHPDDLAGFYRQWDQLRNGECEKILFAYRSLSNGQTGYYRMNARKFGSDRFICIVQNITEISEKEHKLDDANRLFNTLIESLPCLVIAKDADDDLRYLVANAAWRQAVNKPLEAILGKRDLELFALEDAKRFRRDDRHIIESGKTEYYIEEMPSPNGPIKLRTAKTACRFSDGHVYVLAAGVDITEIDRAQQQAEESRMLLRSVFDHAPIGLLLKDPDNDFRYLMWNAVQAGYVGAAENEAWGKPYQEATILPGKADYVRRQDCEVMENGVPMYRQEVRDHDGKRTYFNMAKLPITLPSGKRFLLGAFLDVTEQRQLEESLQRTIRRQNLLLQNMQIYNECLRAVTLSDNYEEAVPRMLAVIGERSNATRCCINCIVEPTDTTDHGFEWAAPGVELQMGIWNSFIPEDAERIAGLLRQPPQYCLLDNQNNPEEYARLRQSDNNRFGTKSILLCALESDGKLWGTIGLSRDSAMPFTPEEIEMLRNCSALFLLAKERAIQKMQIDAAVYLRKMILLNISLPIMLFDAEGQLLSVNPAGRAICGKSEPELLRQPCFMNLCGASPTADNCPMQRCIATGQTAYCEKTMHGREYRLNAEPVLNHLGVLQYVVLTAIDMTETNTGHRKLRDAMIQAQAADRAKTNFISTMNHELRTPLNAVLGFAELLEMGSASVAEQHEYLRNIRNAGQKLLGLINDILDIANLDADATTQNAELFSLSELLRGVESTVRGKINADEVVFSAITPPLLPNKIRLDETRLRRILDNLLGNAAKFTPHGHIAMQTSFSRLSADSGTLKITVSDSGIGIPEAETEKIFEPFQQASNVRGSRAYQGSGMGLAIARHLAEIMHGTITAQSGPGGSIFTLEIRQVPYVL